MREDPPPSEATSGNAFSIYAVDDEEIIGMMIEAMLVVEGYTVKVFTNPIKLLESFTRANPKPKVVVTDYFMPEMNGLELLTRCKQLDPAIKTLLLSGTVEEEFINEHALKPDKFLQKPFRPQALVEILRHLLPI